MSDTNPEPIVDALAEDFARRFRRGERPAVTEYVARHPELEQEIREVLEAVALMERCKPQSQDTERQGAAKPVSAQPPSRLGEFRIVGEIGRGGMGVVYEAIQETLNRRVALKVLPPHLLANQRLRARFQREAQAAARLHHSNIVPVFGVGEADGLCYYAMQLIQGRGLDEIIRALALDAADPGLPSFHGTARLRTAAQVVAQAADALAYAHSRGIVHRDIKPSNLLLDQNGTVWVTDFGVAKVLEESSLTQSGDFVGTLKYMPPERFSGESDAKGDVYSMGITLYELLTLTSAFPDVPPQPLIQLIAQQGPIPVHRLAPHLPRDLVVIVEKAIALNPSQRYASAAELADDLRRFLADQPIKARRVGPLQQAWRWCRRHRVVTGSAAAVFVMLIAATFVSVYAYVRTAAAWSETARANREMQNALAAEQVQREQAERTSALALEALNRIYEHFGASRLVATPSPALSGGLSESVDLPSQPVLLPEAVPLLEELLRTYEQIAAQSAQFERLQAQAAEANHRIGDIHQRLGQADAAIAAYENASRIYQKLLQAGDESVRLHLVRSQNEIGKITRELPDMDRSRGVFERALKLLADAPAEAKTKAEHRYELARTIYLAAQFNILTGPRGPDRGPPGRGPGDPGGPRGFGPVGPRPRDFILGRPPGLPPDRPPPLFHMIEAVELLEKLSEENPQAPEYRHLLACCYRDSPPDLRGRTPWELHEQLDRAVKILRQLCQDFPKTPDYRFDLCETLARIAVAIGPGFQVGQPPERVAERLQEAVELSAELTRQYPGVPQYAAAHAQYLDRLAILHYNAKEYAKAEACSRQALAIQEQLVGRHPDVAAYRLWLSLMQCSLGRARREQGEADDAQAIFENVVRRLETQYRSEPRLAAVQPILNMAYRELALAHQRAGQSQLAAEALKKAEQYGPPLGGPPRPPNARPLVR